MPRLSLNISDLTLLRFSSRAAPVGPDVARKWCQYVRNNKEYQFTAKLTEVFSHAPGRGNKKSSSAETIKYTSQDVEDAKKGFEPLASAGRLGALPENPDAARMDAPLIA